MADVTTPTRYNVSGTNGIFARERGLEQNIIVELVNGVNTVRNWYTHETYISAAYAIGGVSYGTNTYPFVTVDIYYMDCPVSDFLAAVASNGVIPWSTPALCVADHARSCIRKNPNDGLYYMHAGNAWYREGTSDTQRRMDLYTSTTGLPGSWSLAKSNTIPYTLARTDSGNSTFFWDQDESDPNKVLKIHQEYHNGTNYTVGVWWGPDWDNLTAYSGNPIVAIGNNMGELQLRDDGTPRKTLDGKYIIVGHESVNPPTVMPTQLTYWTATNWEGPWTRGGLVLALTGKWHADPTKTYGTHSQLADPSVARIGGKTYIFYEDIWQEQYDAPSLALAWWDADSFAQVIDPNYPSEVQTAISIKRYNGSAYSSLTLKGWDGNAYVPINIRRWDGNTY